MHLEQVKQGYFEHLLDTLRYANISFIAGFVFVIHGLFPDTFTTTGSFLINSLHETLEEKKMKIKK